jgi:hypothetical protein
MSEFKEIKAPGRARGPMTPELRQLIVPSSLEEQLEDPRLAAVVRLEADDELGFALHVEFLSRDRWLQINVPYWTVPTRDIPDSQIAEAIDFCEERIATAKAVRNPHSGQFFTFRRLLILDQAYRSEGPA